MLQRAGAPRRSAAVLWCRWARLAVVVGEQTAKLLRDGPVGVHGTAKGQVLQAVPHASGCSARSAGAYAVHGPSLRGGPVGVHPGPKAKCCRRSPCRRVRCRCARLGRRPGAAGGSPCRCWSSARAASSHPPQAPALSYPDGVALRELSVAQKRQHGAIPGCAVDGGYGARWGRVGLCRAVGAFGRL